MVQRIRTLYLSLIACTCMIATGCGSSEFRAEQVPAKADVQKEIDRVKASTSIPEAAKPSILNGLQKSLARAK